MQWETLTHMMIQWRHRHRSTAIYYHGQGRQFIETMITMLLWTRSPLFSHANCPQRSWHVIIFRSAMMQSSSPTVVSFLCLFRIITHFNAFHDFPWNPVFHSCTLVQEKKYYLRSFTLLGTLPISWNLRPKTTFHGLYYLPLLDQVSRMKFV